MPTKRQTGKMRATSTTTLPHRESPAATDLDGAAPSQPLPYAQPHVGDESLYDSPTSGGSVSNGSGNDIPPTSAESDAGAVKEENQFHDAAAMEAITGRPKQLIKMITELTFLNLDDQIQLPNIVVTGDQSAGKSSLIEAITGIKVPRDAGTCTRCPIHVSLSGSDDSSAEWSCHVSIEKAYNYTPKPPGSTTAHRGEWSEMENRETIPFEALQDPTEVENVLRRAQSAVLNPLVQPGVFKARSARLPKPNSNQVEFSPNIVHLDISGPGLPDLSFFDLPGVISTHKSGEAHLPNLVRTLVMKYLQPEANIVLLAIPMGVDIETCQARALVNDALAEHRTIGVLTKPDQMPLGDPIHGWFAILNGTEHRLGHGYYVTKQPNQMENNAGITHTEARNAESNFFATQHPWSSPEFRLFQHRYGTTSVSAQLSQLLVENIKLSIPRIRSQIYQQIKETDKALRGIPAPTKNAHGAVHDVLFRLHHQVDQSMAGVYPNNQFVNDWKNIIAQTLRKSLKDMRPILFLHTPHVNTQVIEVDSDIDMDNTSNSTPTKKRGKTQQKKESPAKKLKQDNRKLGPRKFDLADIHETLRNVSTSGRPNNIDPRATDSLILEAMEGWDTPFDEFVNETRDALLEELESLLNNNLTMWPSTPLDAESRNSVRDWLDGRIQFVHENVSGMVSAEMLKPLTANVDALADNKKKEWDLLRVARRERRVQELLRKEDQTLNKEMSDAAKAARAKKVTDEQLGEDSYAKELEAVADMRAYYTLAAASLVDGVLKHIQLKLFEACRTTLTTHLRESLHLNEPDAPAICERLLEMNPQFAVMREELLQKKEKYLKAQKRLEGAVRQ